MNEPFIPGSIKPEADYLELERLSTKLGIPVPMMYVTVQATNSDGSPGKCYHDRSRTWNRNFWNIVAGTLTSYPGGAATFGAGYLALENTAATVSAVDFDVSMGDNVNNRQFIYGSLLGTITTQTGIVVGTGTGAESFENVALGAAIAHGAGAGQLVYTAQNITTASYNTSTKVWSLVLVRVFNNNSSGTIVVAETGIYARPVSGTPTGNYMVERSLLGATVSVLAAGQLTVTYTTTLAFPA